MCCRKPHLNLMSDPEEFSLTYRTGRIGPVVFSEIVVGSDLSMNCGDLCNAYRVLVLISGHTVCVHRGVTVDAGRCQDLWMSEFQAASSVVGGSSSFPGSSSPNYWWMSNRPPCNSSNGVPFESCTS